MKRIVVDHFPRHPKDKINVLFLDYDGVVNTPLWNEYGTECDYGTPYQGRVNNYQAVQWVSEFCQKYGYNIVVSSSWRSDPKYSSYLQQGGLREGIEILGRTPYIPDGCRGDEIQQWLDEHSEVGNFIILDDENDMGDLLNHLIQCNEYLGFTYVEFLEAEKLHQSFNSEVESH